MDGVTREEFQPLWQSMVRRYDWQLVQDEALFFDDVVAEYAALKDATSHREQLRMAIWRCYSVLLYRGLYRREERAAQELWIAFVRLAYKDSIADAEAQELAQEAVMRVLDKFPNLRTPQGLLSWALRIFRTVKREHWQQNADNLPLSALTREDEDAEYEPADPSDLATEVENRVMSQEIEQILGDTLTNRLQWEVLRHTVIFADRLCDVARDLGIPPARVRLAKHRALAKLKADPQAMQHIARLYATIGQAPGRTGENGDDT